MSLKAGTGKMNKSDPSECSHISLDDTDDYPYQQPHQHDYSPTYMKLY